MADLDIDELYRKYRGVVYRRARRFFGEEEAAEVTQEIFTRVVSHSDGWRGEASPSTWLFTITTRYCLNHRQKHGRRARLLAESGPPPWSSAVTASNQEQCLMLDQLADTLPEELIMIGVLYYVDDMSHAQIAEIIGVSRRTVGNRLAELTERAQATTQKNEP